MRIERSEPKKTKHTKVLFKKSDLTIGRSSVYSDASQRYFKNTISRIKKDFKNHDYCSHKGKLKRDLSLETDNCILRRYFKLKLTSRTSSAKSKNSNYNGTETIEEYEESSGSGDNKKSTEEDNSNSFNSDVTVLMENLRNLLNVWVEENLTDDSGAKQKFNNVLDSILNKLNIEETKDSSCTTYVLEKGSKSIEIHYRNPSTTNSGICKVCKKRRKPVSSTKLKKFPKRKSCHSSRNYPYRGISSLSVPKYFGENKMRTIYAKDQKTKSFKIDTAVTEQLSATTGNETLVSINSNILPETYYVTQSNVHVLKLFPKIFYKCSTMETKLNANSSRIKNKDMANFDTLPSIVRTMYVNDSVNMASTDADFIEENKKVYTMTDIDCKTTMQSKSAFTVISKQSVINKNAAILCDKVNGIVMQKSQVTTDNNIESDVPTTATILNNSSLKSTKREYCVSNTKRCLKSKVRRKTIKHSLHKKKFTRKRSNKKPRNIYYSRLSRLHITKNKSKNHSANDFIEHINKVIKYFFENSDSKNIKFDININLSPIIDQDMKENNEKCDEDANGNIVNKDKLQTLNTLSNKQQQDEIISPPSVFVYTGNTSSSYPEIIPLLDGAASRAKYILESKNSTAEDSDLSLNNNEMENNNVTCKDIIEIKAMVKDISKRTEKLVCEHFKRKVESSKIQAATNDTNIKDRLPVMPYPRPANIEFKTPTFASHTQTDNLKMIYIDPKVSNTSKKPSYAKVLDEFIINNIWTTNVEAQSQTINNHSIQTSLDNELSAVPSHTKNNNPKNSAKISFTPCLLDTEKMLPVETRSTGIQVSTALSKMPVSGASGLKVTRETKTDTPMKSLKKTVSFDIIESESLVKVTDMTVAEQMNVQSEEKSPTPTSKTKSLVNVPFKNQKQHTITFYCEKCSNKCEFLCNNKKVEDSARSLSKTALKNSVFCCDNTTLENNTVSCEKDVEKSKSNSTKCKPSWQRIIFYFTVVFITATGVTCAIYFYILNSNMMLKTRTNFDETQVSENPVTRRYPFSHRKYSKMPAIRWFSSELGF